MVINRQQKPGNCSINQNNFRVKIGYLLSLSHAR